jgi:co-chaperonin GroES (HSP10)
MSIAKDLLETYDPLFDFLLLRVIPPGCAEGAIAIPDGANDHPLTCRVLKAGPGRESDIVPGKYMEMPVAEGDLVIINPDQAPYLSAKDRDKKVGWIIIVRATSMFCMGKASAIPGGGKEFQEAKPMVFATA